MPNNLFCETTKDLVDITVTQEYSLINFNKMQNVLIYRIVGYFVPWKPLLTTLRQR